MRWPGIVAAYRDLLPAAARVVTLGEGGTPLVPSPSLERRLGRPAWLKLEGCNPTGSFKDRGMTMAVSRALEAGARGVVCASTGNTAASAAAYAARAGLPCWIVLPAGAVARGKLVQASAHGARVVAVDAGFEAALDLAREAASERHVLVNSLNPMRLEGQATVAYELCEALGRPPAVVVLPVGNGGNITACWMGFRRWRDAGRCSALPRMVGVQAEGASPLIRGAPVERPQTVASAIRIGRPASWAGAVEAAAASGGRFVAVSDDDILAAQRALAGEGVFVEPASAAAYAGAGRLDPAVLPDGDVVCVLTGHGLKDPDAVPAPSPERVAATPEAVRALMEGGGGARWP
ncbi:MAG: threonine synthase [Armatimonadota bacterium]|nr:threonine synthase [Armatimonadota bacterium]MDR7421456.1 threonine synthase [Armatimonadota bacterium]MDR7453048.1 threonine synthase [Armatimonadota bacterium]MDR7457754.1 threonine synthase [Armatimonadota bacterium]MDR7497194.1 threonine synthase [Armatimonadota bacterium]